MVFKGLFICCIFVYFILRNLTKINLYKTETFEKKIYKYTVSKKYYGYQVKGLVYLSVYFIFRNIQRIYRMFSLPEISIKGLDIFPKKIYRNIQIRFNLKNNKKALNGYVCIKLRLSRQ